MPINPMQAVVVGPGGVDPRRYGSGVLDIADSWHELFLSACVSEDTLEAPASPLSVDPAPRYFGASYGLLERDRPDVAQLARFAHRVEIASFYMCIAFEKGGVRDFVLDIDANSRPRRGASWFSWLADTTFCRFHLLRRALKHHWTPPADVERLTYSAFNSLCDLTASGLQLKHLYMSERTAAIDSLVTQLDLTAKLLEETVSVATKSEAVVHERVAADDAMRLAAATAEILARVGETLSLRDAAKRLGTSHQALHKRVQIGSALGVKQGRDLVIPAFQFVADGDKWMIVPGVKDVLSIFETAEAGPWAALQFLADPDPLLGDRPIAVLTAGDVDAVVRAARASLGLDES